MLFFYFILHSPQEQTYYKTHCYRIWFYDNDFDLRKIKYVSTRLSLFRRHVTYEKLARDKRRRETQWTTQKNPIFWHSHSHDCPSAWLRPLKELQLNSER